MKATHHQSNHVNFPMSLIFDGDDHKAILLINCWSHESSIKIFSIGGLRSACHQISIGKAILAFRGSSASGEPDEAAHADQKTGCPSAILVRQGQVRSGNARSLGLRDTWQRWCHGTPGHLPSELHVDPRHWWNWQIEHVCTNNPQTRRGYGKDYNIEVWICLIYGRQGPSIFFCITLEGIQRQYLITRSTIIIVRDCW